MQLTVPILKQTLNLASIICRVRINRRDITSDHLALLLMCLNSRAFLSFTGGLSSLIRRWFLVSFDMLIYTIIGENCLLLILERGDRNFLIVLELVIVEETELLLIGVCLSILRRTIL